MWVEQHPCTLDRWISYRYGASWHIWGFPDEPDGRTGETDSKWSPMKKGLRKVWNFKYIIMVVVILVFVALNLFYIIPCTSLSVTVHRNFFGYIALPNNKVFFPWRKGIHVWFNGTRTCHAERWPSSTSYFKHLFFFGLDERELQDVFDTSHH